MPPMRAAIDRARPPARSGGGRRWIPALVALVEGIRYLTLKQPEFAQKAARMDGPFAFLW